MTIQLSGADLVIEKLIKVTRENDKVELHPDIIACFQEKQSI